MSDKLLSIFFCNDTEIDMRAFSLMGVSVKKTENPFGYFGTGLKYAVATCLRNGCQIKLHTSNGCYPITAVAENFRGESIQVVTMNGKSLEFTTDLGKKWEMWQAFRELYANAHDEGGFVTDDNPHGATIIEVIGLPIVECYRQRGSIFLKGQPRLKDSALEVYDLSHPHHFYRGVRMQKMENPTVYTYNILAHMDLTEDRTLASPFMFKYYLRDLVVTCKDEEFIAAVLGADTNFYESKLDFSDYTGRLSEEFVKVMDAMNMEPRLNRTVRELRAKNKHYGHKTATYSEVIPSDETQKTMNRALTLVENVLSVGLYGVLNRDRYVWGDGLGKLLSVEKGDKLLISLDVRQKGVAAVATLIYLDHMSSNKRTKGGPCTVNFEMETTQAMFQLLVRERALEYVHV